MDAHMSDTVAQPRARRLTPASAAASRRRAERVFYTGMAALFAATVLAGFARTYYLRSYFGSPELDLLRHAHGVVFTAWLVLLVVQTSLVAANRTPLHRRLGIAGLFVAGAMIVVGTLTALVRAKLVELPPGSPPPLAFLTIPLGDLVVFGTLFALAYRWRQWAGYHKRLMLLATIAILPAAVARLPFAFIQRIGPLAFFGLADGLIVVCALFDLITERRVHRATLWGGLLVVLSHPLRLVIGNTSGWLAFAEWLTAWVA
jgi:hypothetical protein